MVAQVASPDCTTGKSPGPCERIPFVWRIFVAMSLLSISTGIFCIGCRTRTAETGILTQWDDNEDKSSPKLDKHLKEQIKADLEKEQ